MRHYLWLRSPFQSIIPTGKFVCGQEANALKSFKKQIGSKKLVLKFWCTLGPKQCLTWMKKYALCSESTEVFTSVSRYHQEREGTKQKVTTKCGVFPIAYYMHIAFVIICVLLLCMYVCSKYWRVSSTHLEECCVGEHQSNFGSCHHI